MKRQCLETTDGFKPKIPALFWSEHNKRQTAPIKKIGKIKATTKKRRYQITAVSLPLHLT